MHAQQIAKVGKSTFDARIVQRKVLLQWSNCWPKFWVFLRLCGCASNGHPAPLMPVMHRTAAGRRRRRGDRSAGGGWRRPGPRRPGPRPRRFRRRRRRHLADALLARSVIKPPPKSVFLAGDAKKCSLHWRENERRRRRRCAILITPCLPATPTYSVLCLATTDFRQSRRARTNCFIKLLLSVPG